MPTDRSGAPLPSESWAHYPRADLECQGLGRFPDEPSSGYRVFTVGVTPGWPARLRTGAARDATRPGGARAPRSCPRPVPPRAHRYREAGVDLEEPARDALRIVVAPEHGAPSLDAGRRLG